MRISFLRNDAPDVPRVNSTYAWVTLWILILAYIVSFIDRQIIILLVDPIRATLNLSDTEFSLLHGLAFALFYTILGIPIGQLIDRRRRTTIIAIGIVIWSVMTAACGLARNFTHLFLARIGVGVGEAALTPGAYSLLSDLFTPKELPKALSMYAGAAHVGSGVAIIAGGALIALVPGGKFPIVGILEPWQAVFMVVGLPGLLLAAFVLRLREPERIGVQNDVNPSFRAVVSYIGDRKAAYGLLILGYSVLGLIWNGAVAWLPTFFIRVHEWTADEVGVRYGLTMMIAGASGVLVGGSIAMKARGLGRLDANVLIGLIAILVIVPAGAIMTQVNSDLIALGLVGIFLFGCAMPWGGAASALQEISPNQMRGQISAIYLFATNLIGMGLGPTAVASVTDLVLTDPIRVGDSITLLIFIFAPVSATLLAIVRRPYICVLRRAVGALPD
jgi:MFS family permease